MKKPELSIIVPCRNERGYIESFISSILGQEFGGMDYEVLIADGSSTDGTLEVLELLSKDNPRIKVISNERQFVSTGLNIATKLAAGEIIIRMDVHTRYAGDYILQCVTVLKETKMDNVGGAWVAKGKTWMQKIIAIGFQSAFSSGGARSHDIAYEGEVDSVYLGCWYKNTLLKAGLFDEQLVRNQDDELNLRFHRQGLKVWQSPRIKSWYYPRKSLAALFRQYSQYGYWKVRVIQKHSIPAALRHIVPSLFLVVIIGSAMMSLFFNSALWVFIPLVTLYLLINIIVSALTCRQKGVDKCYLVLPLVFSAFHFGYGWGFLLGVWDFRLVKRFTRSKYRALTR